jgi:predicted ATPase
MQTFRYARKVFMTPPWPELFRTDSERIHSYADAVAEYAPLMQAYERLGHEVVILPKISVKERVDFILKELGI